MEYEDISEEDEQSVDSIAAFLREHVPVPSMTQTPGHAVKEEGERMTRTMVTTYGELIERRGKTPEGAQVVVVPVDITTPMMGKWTNSAKLDWLILDQDILRAHLVFFPIYKEKWWSLVIMDPAAQYLGVYCHDYGLGARALEAVQEFMNREHDALTPEVVPVYDKKPIIRFTNISRPDSGVVVMSLMEQMARGVEANVSAERIPELRGRIAASLSTGRLQ